MGRGPRGSPRFAVSPRTFESPRVATDELNRGNLFPSPVGLAELFVAVLIVGVSAVNTGLPLAVWTRVRDGRFLLLAAASAVLALLGAVWTWGQLPLNPPSFATVQLPVLLIVFLAVLLLLASTLWPRHA
jgi:hypothetical protein